MCCCDVTAVRRHLVTDYTVGRRLNGSAEIARSTVTAAVVVVAADQFAVAATQCKLVTGNKSALTRDTAETVHVVDAIARPHHQVDAVEAEAAAGTLDAE